MDGGKNVKESKAASIVKSGMVKLKRHGTRALNDFVLKYSIREPWSDSMTMDHVMEGKLEKRAYYTTDFPPFNELFAFSSPVVSPASIDKRDRDENEELLSSSQGTIEDKESNPLFLAVNLVNENDPDAPKLTMGMVDFFSVYRPSRHLLRKTVVDSWMDNDRELDDQDPFTRLTIKQFIHLARDLDKPFFHEFAKHENIREGMKRITGKLTVDLENDTWKISVDGSDSLRTDDFAHTPLAIKLSELGRHAPDIDHGLPENAWD